MEMRKALAIAVIWLMFGSEQVFAAGGNHETGQSDSRVVVCSKEEAPVYVSYIFGKTGSNVEGEGHEVFCLRTEIIDTQEAIFYFEDKIKADVKKARDVNVDVFFHLIRTLKQTLASRN